MTWGIAENFRFLDPVDYAREEVLKIGKITGFSLVSLGNVKSGTKYFGEFKRWLCV